MSQKFPQFLWILLLALSGWISCSQQESKIPPSTKNAARSSAETVSSAGGEISSSAGISHSVESSSSSEANSESSSSEAGKVRVAVKNASGSGEYAPGTKIFLAVSREKLESHCLGGWTVSPAQYKKNLKHPSADTALFEVPDAPVKINARFKHCFSDVPSIVVGKLRWMTKNLNVWTSQGSSCYKGNSDNCAKFGRLYDFERAKKVCSSGWRLPTDAEWNSLTADLGENAGEKLKSKTGWAMDDGDSGNGTDSLGFDALPSGIVYEDNYIYLGYHAYFWTATERDAETAYYRALSYNSPESYRYYNFKSAGYAVRCVQDVP